jgi:F-type H+-transporting ATPase subunit epsilon
MTIHVEITSQDRTVYSGEADIVVVPGSAGEMGILPHHSPLLSTLKFGVVKVRSKEGEQIFTVAGGIVEVQPDQVTILADAAENVLEIDIHRADEARKRAEEQLAKAIPQDTDTYLSLQAALRRSNLRLDAVKKFKKDQR